MEDIAEMMMNKTRHYESAFIDGKDEGRLEGLAEGRLEGQLATQNKIATNMLKKGMKISDIIEITGLSKEDTRKLKLQVKL